MGTRQRLKGQAAEPSNAPEAQRWAAGDTVAQWFAGKSYADLDAIEHEGRPLYPDAIKRRSPKTGQIEEISVSVRVPNTIEKSRARLHALRWFTEQLQRGEMLTIAEAIAHFGETYFNEIDNVAIMALAIRERKAPHGQFQSLEGLLRNYSIASLWDVWDRLNYYQDQEDPRMDELNEAEFWAAVEAIDKRRSLAPLLAMRGGARDSFIRSMAYQLASSRSRSSSWPSIETSTQGASPETT
jgi:hypothetical protein